MASRSVEVVIVGAAFDKHGGVDVDRNGVSSVPGLFVAAGEGAAAAVSINEYLCQKELYAEPRT